MIYKIYILFSHGNPFKLKRKNHTQTPNNFTIITERIQNEIYQVQTQITLQLLLADAHLFSYLSIFYSLNSHPFYFSLYTTLCIIWCILVGCFPLNLNSHFVAIKTCRQKIHSRVLEVDTIVIWAPTVANIIHH